MSLTWEHLDVDSLKKSLNVVDQAKIDGSNNLPGSGKSSLSETENKIKETIKKHYIDQVRYSVEASEILENDIRICKELTQEDGHKQLFDEVKSEWKGIFESFKDQYQRAKGKLDETKLNLETFRRQNNIFAGREPIERSWFKFFLTLLIPISLATVEIYLNVGILSDVLGGANAISISAMVSIINVGLSFLVGRLCLTNLFHPVSTSASRWIYISTFILFLVVLVYVNFMMGVFRGVNEAAQLATDRSTYRALAEAALYKAVFPFDDLNSITFDSVWLILVGFFFGLFSLLDGYYFDDPINGYGSLGRKRQRAQINFDQLVSEGPQLLDNFSRNSIDDLRIKKEERLKASFKWGSIIDALQADMQSYKFFCENISSSMNSLLSTYTTTNITFRSSDEPDHFSEEISTDFILEFADAHPNIKYELKDDEEKVNQLKINEEIIDREYKATHKEFTNLFDSQREEVFSVINS
ncbi:MAG: hypothetical protein VX169_03060 [Pseudomonadota bacterium]|nr:hypothetical protein [Pseudomonadota bacterium]